MKLKVIELYRYSVWDGMLSGLVLWKGQVYYANIIVSDDVEDDTWCFEERHYRLHKLTEQQQIEELKQARDFKMAMYPKFRSFDENRFACVGRSMRQFKLFRMKYPENRVKRNFKKNPRFNTVMEDDKFQKVLSRRFRSKYKIRR